MNAKNPENIFKIHGKGTNGRFFKLYKKIADVTEKEFQMCTPINLEDVLVELGWKRRGFVNNYYTKINGYYIQWSNSPQLRYLLKMKHPDKDDFLHIHDVKYLHQLQNIFETFTGVKLPNIEKLLKS